MKEKVVKMTNIRKFLVLGMTTAVTAVAGLSFAQDDLDALLKDLEAENVKPEQKAEASAKSGEAEASPQPAAKPEEKAEEKAEEPAKPEAKSEEPEAKPEEKAEEKPEEPVKNGEAVSSPLQEET